VPQTVRPDLPKETERAIEVLGNRVRVAVLRSLLTVGSATRGQLSDRLGVSMALLQKHLAALEKLGAVTLDPPRTQPGVRPRTYSADRANVLAIANALSTTFDSQ
jgi:DNA-binding HxlR family transcriptional regulator